MIFCTATIPAHPHVCGEHSRKISDIPQLCGSSPRVWGARSRAARAVTRYRLIPTCVGSTPLSLTAALHNTAHPHVCVEHLQRPCLVRRGVGSSPRVWGAHAAAVASGDLERLIPTCVGSTHPKPSRAPPTSAHPHVCGEHYGFMSGILWGRGSSPRVWGALSVVVGLSMITRLIPTCVGSTTPMPITGKAIAAHPHVCGEHERLRREGFTFVGSSPRVWGAHLLTWDFIPTHQVLELVWSPKPVLTLHDFWAYRRREARLYLLALLHPFRGPRSSFGTDGRIISFTPSKSTGSHG